MRSRSLRGRRRGSFRWRDLELALSLIETTLEGLDGADAEPVRGVTAAAGGRARASVLRRVHGAGCIRVEVDLDLWIGLTTTRRSTRPLSRKAVRNSCHVISRLGWSGEVRR